MPDYPNRPQFFAHKFCRLLTKTAAAMEIGPEACWMLSIIAGQEDSKRYTGPVLYWNDQLRNLCGFGSHKRLRTARERAVAAGWLHYEPGHKSTAPRYWVLIPPQYTDLPDGPCDENPTEYTCETHLNNGLLEGETHLNNSQLPDSCNDSHLNGATEGQLRGNQGATEGQTFLPSPSPIPQSINEGATERTTGGILEGNKIPEAVWLADTELQVFHVIRPWLDGWAGNDTPKMAILAAVLATREADAEVPQTYVERCLTNGVRPKWLHRAKKLYRSQTQPIR